MTEPLLFTIPQAARIVNVSARKLGKMVECGELSFKLVGARRMVPREEIIRITSVIPIESKQLAQG